MRRALQPAPLARRRSRGSELVEFALMLPGLAMLLLVVSQAAGAVATYQILCNAAREGARVAIVPGEYGRAADVQNTVVAYALANGVPLTTGAVTVNQNALVSPSGGACSGANACMQSSQVSVAYTYVMGGLLGASMQLGTSAEMRNLY
jgi:Flp pilus assembly protein TadG